MLQIADLERSYEQSVADKERLTKNISETQVRLQRAAKLTTGLADEQVRWTESVEVSFILLLVLFKYLCDLKCVQKYDGEISNVAGNVFIAAACVAYNGAFTNSYREKVSCCFLYQLC